MAKKAKTKTTSKKKKTATKAKPTARKTKAPKVEKEVAATEAVADSGVVELAVAPTPSVTEPTTLEVNLTSALKTKITRMAQEEGVDVPSLVQELLAESVTLRAWEILERKAAMRGPSQNQGNFQQNRHGGGNGNRRGNHRGGGNRGNGGNNWMEDKASFLEYVRNQEKRRR